MQCSGSLASPRLRQASATLSVAGHQASGTGCSRTCRLPQQQQHRQQQRQRSTQLVVRAARNEQPRGARQAGGFDGRLEAAVPREQRPVNELQQLKDTALLSWATLDLGEYAKRLIILYSGVFLLLGGPIAAQTFPPQDQPLEFFLSASTGSLLVVAVAALRIFLAWKYVGDRLLTASLEYEETGWYDGQVFVKPPEVLARDRLLGTYEVKPVLARLRTTLQAVGVGLLATAVTLTVVVRSGADSDYVSGAVRKPANVTPTGITYSAANLDDLATDDEAAALEAEAQVDYEDDAESAGDGQQRLGGGSGSGNAEYDYWLYRLAHDPPPQY